MLDPANQQPSVDLRNPRSSNRTLNSKVPAKRPAVVLLTTGSTCLLEADHAQRMCCVIHIARRPFISRMSMSTYYYNAASIIANSATPRLSPTSLGHPQPKTAPHQSFPPCLVSGAR